MLKKINKNTVFITEKLTEDIVRNIITGYIPSAYNLNIYESDEQMEKKHEVNAWCWLDEYDNELEVKYGLADIKIFETYDEQVMISISKKGGDVMSTTSDIIDDYKF